MAVAIQPQPSEPSSLVIRNAHVMTCAPDRDGLGMIARGAIVIDDGKIAWAGENAACPRGATREIDANGRLVTPGLVDCHTHAIFGGERAHEFAMRAAGNSYLEIAAAGGGIASTVSQTIGNPASALRAFNSHLRIARAHGTTTMEVKSGYGLSAHAEIKLIAGIWSVAKLDPRTRVVPTLLAHVVPKERAHDRDAYVREWCTELIPGIAEQKAATSFDIYCDDGAFTLAEARQMFDAAKRAGLAVRAHVGQFSDLGGAELCAEFGALSADHLEYVSDAGIAALARAGTVAVMLPGACVQLRLPVPPVERFRKAGVAMAVATDLNPGSSYCETLPIQMWLATTHFGMTVEEAWLGVTRNAARALAVEAGAIVPGARAALVLWNCEQPAEVPYRYGTNLVAEVIA